MLISTGFNTVDNKNPLRMTLQLKRNVCYEATFVTQIFRFHTNC
jgi:hypothetical protein